MATGTGWQQYGSSAGNSSTGAAKYNYATTSTMPYQTGLSLEYTPDLHLKMSKKIAQLTKEYTFSGDDVLTVGDIGDERGVGQLPYHLFCSVFSVRLILPVYKHLHGSL
ncbi:UNVERIFIED_CONTAM: hypothetical protein FKN15_071605 [Acipenser sinensis]